MLVITLTAALAVTGAKAQNGRERLERFVDALAAEHDLHVAIAVTRDGETLLAKGYGLADREHGVPNTPTTKFRIGSVTKQFTAMAIMMLQEQGNLRVEDPLSTHLADLPDTWRSLTIHQLLTHTSGLMHPWALAGFAETMAEPRTLQETIDRFRDQPLVFEPGDGFSYSGLGYFLLARVIEEVAGQSYEEFLRRHVFEPLGMHDTGSDRPGLDADGRARGYYWDNGVIRAPPIHMPILTGGGNLFSTVEDLVRWERALRENQLISAKAYEALYRAERDNYAYGWWVREVDGRRAIYHSGGVPGFTAYIIRYPDQAVCVVVLSNVQTSMGAVARAIAREVLEHSP